MAVKKRPGHARDSLEVIDQALFLAESVEPKDTIPTDGAAADLEAKGQLEAPRQGSAEVPGSFTCTHVHFNDVEE
jgi:hypothetical protein